MTVMRLSTMREVTGMKVVTDTAQSRLAARYLLFGVMHVVTAVEVAEGDKGAPRARGRRGG